MRDRRHSPQTPLIFGSPMRTPTVQQCSAARTIVVHAPPARQLRAKSAMISSVDLPFRAMSMSPFDNERLPATDFGAFKIVTSVDVFDDRFDQLFEIRFSWLRFSLNRQFLRGRAIFGDRSCDMLRSDMRILKHEDSLSFPEHISRRGGALWPPRRQNGLRRVLLCFRTAMMALSRSLAASRSC